MKNNIYVVIPARYASSRLPGKPLIKLDGVPMVVRVYQQVKNSLPLCEVVVAIDDIRIASELDLYSIPYVMTSTKHLSGSDRVAEVCLIKGWERDSVVVNVQGDEPLIPSDLLNDFLSFLDNNCDLSAATVSAPINDCLDLVDKNTVKVITDINNNALYFSRLPIPCNRDTLENSKLPLSHYRKHVGIYAYRISVLLSLTSHDPVTIENDEKLEQLRVLWLGYKMSVMEWHSEPPPGVDSPKDVHYIEQLLKSNEND